MNVVWYRRRVMVPAEWAGRQVLLHFQAVDYDATVWVDGEELVRHRGGSTPFTVNLGSCAGNEVEIVVRARDFQQELKPQGKQSRLYHNHTCHYTRTTGIWQTVWMEPVAETYLLRTRITPNLADHSFWIEQPVSGTQQQLQFQAALRQDGVEIARQTVDLGKDFQVQTRLEIPQELVRVWEPGDPYLYQLSFSLVKDGHVIDRVESYAGLRGISIEGHKVLLNGKSVFQRLVLDQGYYSDGILTAPNEEALVRDIELSMAAGFNGARLHQKVFEERFLYHADRLGYLVWGEFPDWGCNQGGPAGDNQQPGATYITQWLEELERDYSHPSIVGWCPLNETWQWMKDQITVLDDVTRGMFLAAKAMDGTRPVLDASGYAHRVPEADIYDSHNYEQALDKFSATFSLPVVKGRVFENEVPEGRQSLPYHGGPYFLSEFGGIWWNEALAQQMNSGTDREVSWGYGDRPRNIEEVYERFEGMCNVLLDNPGYFGYCYTQLTDVFQEMNGIFDFQRTPKFDLRRLHQIQTRTAAIEASGAQ
jgi:beta-galactosidase/beta-glucuronidase